MLTNLYFSLLAILSFAEPSIITHQSSLINPSLATFSYTIAPCGDTVTFTDQCGGFSWQWSFPGGSPSSSTLQNPTVVYSTPGSYQVCLTAIIPGSVCQACDTIQIHCESQPPTLLNCPADITVTGSFDAVGLCSADIQIASPTVTDNCDPNPTLTNNFNNTNNASGNYPQGSTGVTFTATDACGNVSTCSFKVTVECSSTHLPENCGKAVITCFSGFNTPSNYLSGVNQNAPVMALVDIRDHSTATPGVNWTQASSTEFTDPSWTPQNLGQIFGIAIDSSGDIFVAASTIYTCATTSPYVYNPFTSTGGAGAVYKIDGTTWAVSNYTTTGAFTPGGTTIPNNGSALGDIGYDALHDQFFVTNHADGMIYRIKNGLVMSRFDPFGTVNPPSSGVGSNPGFVALGERTWGVAYFNNRVYFSTWTEDIQRQNPAAANEIWSIGLDGAGEFQGTFFNGGSQKWEDGEVLEITLPCYPVSANYSNPVSDIAFSKAGRMLLAERTMSSDCGGAFTTNWYGYAHSSRLLEYEFTGTWTLTPGHTGSACAANTNKKFTTGAANAVTDNSAGGTDYGYASFTPPATTPPDCDRFAWNTGDNLHPPTGFNVPCSQPGTTWLYGMQGTPATGGTNVNSLLVDFDNNVCSHDKILIGDVEIFRCGCRSAPSDFPCDSLWVTKKPLEPDPTTPPDTCCWDIDFHIHHGPVAYLEAESLTPGVIFNNAALNPQFQWGGTPTNTLLPIAWGSPGHGIPQGDYNSALRFCLGNITTPQQDTQCVVFRWYVFGPTDEVFLACTDTCYFFCPPPVFGDTCVVIKNDSVACNPDKPLEYCYFFQVQNLTGFSANQVVLSNPTPGFGFKPCPPPNIPFTSPTIALPVQQGIPPDSCSPTLCVKIVATSPILSPTTFCFDAGLSSNDSCCHSPKEHCITLEPCCDPCEDRRLTVHTTNPDSCCHSLDISNDCNLQFFTKLELALLTPGVIFGSHYTGGPMPGDWWNPISTNTLVQWQHISGFVPNGVTPGLINFCLDGIDNPSEVPQVVVLNWITTSSTGEDSIACSDTLVFDCPAQDFGCIDVIEDKITCEEDENGNTFYQYMLTFHNASNPPHFATELIFTQLAGPPVTVFPNPVNFFPPGANFCDTTTITTNFFPSGNLPPGTKLTFLVRLHDAFHPDNWCCFEGDTLCIIIPPCGDDCVCAPADLSLVTGGTVFGITCQPNGLVPTLPCPAGDVTISGFFGCRNSTGTPCPETPVTWSLTGPNGVISSGTTTNFPVLTFPASQVGAAGMYCLTLATLCPGSVDSCVCTVCWIQPECGDGCCTTFDEFCALVNQGFSLALSVEDCKVIATTSQFDSCHWFGTPPDWGDGTLVPQVLVPANGMWMHTYAQSGTYNICVTVYEFNSAGQACWSKQMCTPVTVVCDTLCPANLVQNGSFSSGTPNGNDETIGLATNWSGIWTGGSTGDFYHTVLPQPPGVLTPPLPVTQGNFAGMWNYVNSSPVWREGIMNQLSGVVPQNSGCYDLSLKLACLNDPFGAPVFSAWGVPVGAVSTGTPGPFLPTNPNLFTPVAIPLGNYTIPLTCDENFQTIVFNFNSSALPAGGIDRIFFTRADGANGGVYVAVDDVCLAPAPCEPVDTCCGSLELFCQTIENAVSISVDNANCKVKVTIGNLPACHYLEWVNWGDGQQNNGPFGGGSMGMHTYAGSGTYVISYLAIATNANGVICLEKVLHDTIHLDCPPVCVCATPNLSLTTTGASYLLGCNQQGPALGCPASDVTISGTFGCVSNVPGTTCPDTPVSWTLFGPNGLVASGTGVSPNFSETFPAASVSAAGTYTLTLQTLCPGAVDTCVCVITWFQADCPSCVCEGFTKIKIQNKKTGLNQALACNNQPPVPIPCPPSGKPHKITGKLVCLGGCPGTVNWTVMNPLGATVLSGSSAGSPWFSIAIPSTAVTMNGLYMVKIQGLCDGDTCNCKLNLLFDGCAPDCKCEPLGAFQAEVNKGFHFTSAGSSTSGCIENIIPNGVLTECDQITWILKNPIGVEVGSGTTVGNAPFIFTFKPMVKYQVCMKVKRTEPNGTMCMHEVCRPVIVNCDIPALACSDPVMENPGFSVGAVQGTLGINGASEGWTRRAGTPEILAQPTCADPFAIKIDGNCLISDILDHTVTLEAGKPYRYRFCFDLDNDINSGTPAGGVVVGRISTQPQTTGACVGECEEIFRVSEAGASFNWAEAQGQFTPNLSGNLFLTLHVENDFVEDELSSQSPALIDNVCIEKDTVTATGEVAFGKQVSLFPNPTTGELTLRFEAATPKAGKLQILDLWGRVILKESLQAEEVAHTFSLKGMPAGVYFVKVLENGETVWLGKVVKQ